MPAFAQNPEISIDDSIASLEQNQTQWMSVHYELDQYYLSNPSKLELIALVEIDASGIRYLSVGEYSIQATELCESVQSHREMLAVTNSLQWPCIDCKAPIELSPIAIAKPWGQEIWYTGVEARGQSQFTDGEFASPIPWLLSAAPTKLAGALCRELNLLKILDPLPEPVFGDLYFELHEEKQEVYVVTNISTQSWPDKRGKIRIGFDQAYKAEFSSDDDFIESFSASVKTYESIRREIDRNLDQMRNAEGIDLNDPVPAAQTKRWLSSVDTNLLVKEQELREKMDRFKGALELTVGDVLKVPCFTPHSLMHGVRTIEFQTPVYERKIVSFAQKVLTQENWDTDSALKCMSLDDHKLQPLKQLHESLGVLIEEVVDFSDFTVVRITLAPGAQSEFALSADYAVAIGVKGAAQVSGKTIAAEQAFFFPKIFKTSVFINESNQESVLLVSTPK